MEKLTFDQLPEAVALLLEKVTRIEQLLDCLAGGALTEEMLTVEQAAKFLDLSVSRIYKMSHHREIPVYKPSGKKSYFKRQDLLDYKLRNRVASTVEIEQETTDYVLQRRKDSLRWQR